MDRFEAFLIDVGVDLGGGDVGVAEEFLNDAKVGPVFEEVGREGVSEKVGVDVLFEAGFLGPFFDDLTNAGGGERAAADGYEEVGRGFAGDESRAFVGEVLLDGDEGALADGDQSGFVALSGDAEELVFLVEEFEAGVGKFGESEAGGIEEFEEREVSFAQFFLGIDGREELFEVLLVEGFGELSGGFGWQERRGGIGGDEVFFEEEAEEDFEVDEGDAERFRGEVCFAKVPEKGGEMVGGDFGVLAEFLGIGPRGKFFESLTDGELVSRGKATLGGEIEDELFDGDEHVGFGNLRRGARRGKCSITKCFDT